jgi:hypothetical protein
MLKSIINDDDRTWQVARRIDGGLGFHTIDNNGYIAAQCKVHGFIARLFHVGNNLAAIVDHHGAVAVSAISSCRNGRPVPHAAKDIDQHGGNGCFTGSTGKQVANTDDGYGALHHRALRGIERGIAPCNGVRVDTGGKSA